MILIYVLYVDKLPTCEYEYCDTLISGLELIDNLYCSSTCKKFDTKLKLAQEKKPIVKLKIDDPRLKLPSINREVLLTKLKNRINKRKQPSKPSIPEKIPRIDYYAHQKNSIIIQALCDNPIDKSFSKKIIKSQKGSLSDDEETLHLKVLLFLTLKLNHFILITFLIKLQKWFVFSASNRS